MTAHDTPHRPMRRDAVRNQQLVIDAARDVLSEVGTDASMELIASRAGVGVGTVYRRFPNKEALVDEIAGLMLSELVEEGRRALALGDGTGLEVFMRAIGHSLARHRGCADKLIGHSKTGSVEELRDLAAELLDQARQSGRVGPVIELGDVMTALWGMRGIVETSGGTAPDAWERYLDIHLAGFRAPDLVSERPAVTRAQLAEISHNKTSAAAAERR
jgi:AcrR family transcriptional regulator